MLQEGNTPYLWHRFLGPLFLEQKVLPKVAHESRPKMTNTILKQQAEAQGWGSLFRVDPPQLSCERRLLIVYHKCSCFPRLPFSFPTPFPVPRVVAVSPQMRLVEDNPSSLSLVEIYKQRCAKKGIEHDSPISRYYDRLATVQARGTQASHQVLCLRLIQLVVLFSRPAAPYWVPPSGTLFSSFDQLHNISEWSRQKTL